MGTGEMAERKEGVGGQKPLHTLKDGVEWDFLPT